MLSKSQILMNDSVIYRDGGGVHDSSVDVDVVKTKHPAARVLEQQVRDESHSPALTRVRFAAMWQSGSNA